ncbi:Hypothetical protein NTJ_09846 [Nesidiocoris tenuis]|uniref:Uncharacterized protein n=1 Tax=Nesidiocoris tenuis TaxID=355587 RepID=A0ABN7AXY6_9HEMI|nr:Hypothetical protein NTJ_09846 [Nesidiocoris tenuis]
MKEEVEDEMINNRLPTIDLSLHSCPRLFDCVPEFVHVVSLRFSTEIFPKRINCHQFGLTFCQNAAR